MANPQKENGYTGIANELLGAIISAKLNGTEYAVLLHVVRQTYGYLKKEDWISYTQFEKASRRTRPNVWKAIESLVTKKILVTKKELVTKTKLVKTFYRLNKDYSQWVVTKTKLVTKKKQTSYEKEMEVVTKTKHTKESITKERKKGGAPPLLELGDNSFVRMTNGDYRKLCQKYGGRAVNRFVADLDIYANAYPKRVKDYKSHYHVIMKWINTAKSEGKFKFDWQNYRESDFDSKEDYQKILNKLK